MLPCRLPRQVDTRARFPYASLVLWDLGNAYGTCSGSLVAPGFVLTAAHVSGRGWASQGVGVGATVSARGSPVHWTLHEAVGTHVWCWQAGVCLPTPASCAGRNARPRTACLAVVQGSRQPAASAPPASARRCVPGAARVQQPARVVRPPTLPPTPARPLRSALRRAAARRRLQRSGCGFMAPGTTWTRSWCTRVRTPRTLRARCAPSAQHIPAAFLSRGRAQRGQRTL